MREVQASCSSDLDLGQAGRAREGGGGSLCFLLFPLPEEVKKEVICPEDFQVFLKALHQ